MSNRIQALKPQPLRLLDQLQEAAFAKFERPEPAERYLEWVRRFILFHGKRHPRERASPDVSQFLCFLAKSEHDPLRALEQARAPGITPTALQPIAQGRERSERTLGECQRQASTL